MFMLDLALTYKYSNPYLSPIFYPSSFVTSLLSGSTSVLFAMSSFLTLDGVLWLT